MKRKIDLTQLLETYMNESNNGKILTKVSEYYSQKLNEFGVTPKGVDWNSLESQLVRFRQLSKIIDASQDEFSISDIGCGYGALFDYLLKQNKRFEYYGYDVSIDMINQAKDLHKNLGHCQFIHESKCNTVVDYVIASGIFNVRLDVNVDEWRNYILSTLDMMNSHSRHGFAFNCLTSYSDQNCMKDYLFYADPLELFNYCKITYSKQVALLHDYDLYEFTILVRKF